MSELSALQVKLNLRPLDLEILYKFVPEAIKQEALPKNASFSEIKDSFDVLVDAIEKRRLKKVTQLRPLLQGGCWAFFRWGKSLPLGKTFLCIIKDTTSSDKVGVFTSKGFTYVPIWWCQRVFSPEELECVKEWTPGPNLPEMHPVKTDKFLKTAFESGFLEPLHRDAKALALAFATWNPRQLDLAQKLKKLNDDELDAVFHAVQEERLSKEKLRLKRSHADQLPKGSWISIKPDLSKELTVVLLDHLHETSELIVWYPDKDLVDRVPEHWMQKHLIEKGRVKINQDGQIDEKDKTEYSQPYRLLKLKKDTKDIKEKIAIKSIRELSDADLNDWHLFFKNHKSNLHKLIRERGQNLLDWFDRWQDPLLPNFTSKTTLKFEANHPLKVLLVLSYFEKEEHLGDFLRAEILLFEGMVRSKDKALEVLLETLVK